MPTEKDFEAFRNIMEEDLGDGAGHSFFTWLKSTSILQAMFFKDGDPANIDTDEARIAFITWNFTALVCEAVEMLDECGWKPWATSKHINRDQMIGEIVDQMHFQANILRALNCDGIELSQRYVAKQMTNARRMVDGYDGVVGKCVQCHRDLAEVSTGSTFRIRVSTTLVLQFCSENCYINYGPSNIGRDDVRR